MSQPTEHFRYMADAFILATNASNLDHALSLFSQDAVIDDPSTGHRFDGHDGIRNYIEQYFIGYHTVTQFLSMNCLGYNKASVRVDFTGDFGHEIGKFEITLNAEGLIARIDADLE